MRSTPFSFATLMAIAAMGSAAQAVAAPIAAGRGQRGLKHVIGPAANWPSGKVYKRRSHYPDGQCAKLPKQRKHKQHQHPLRDEHGAYTLTGFRGMLPEVVGQDGVTGEFVIEMRYFSARKWLAGISAQRGY